jgi:hypothetical protein
LKYQSLSVSLALRTGKFSLLLRQLTDPKIELLRRIAGVTGALQSFATQRETDHFDRASIVGSISDC